ncbi:MAG: hypothetical protein EOO38_08205 [Cytophagaceae bacterium]|nr:MAG: hypothetical protein EOO38_08205 [Cytophagaceae bacterium]
MGSRNTKSFWQYIRDSWERILFGCVGAACLCFTFIFLLRGAVTSASAVFAMAFFSFFYSNLARFKKFKGLGFEAELWEDKQKEAAHLIDRLKSVVSVYTREIVMNNVMRGRWGGSVSWKSRWGLLEELKSQHSELGQNIDFTDLRQEVESVFIFDICTPLASSVRKSIEAAKTEANKIASERFGSPITDIEGWNRYHEQLRAISSHEDELFERAKTQNVAEEILRIAREAQRYLAETFSISVQFKDGVLERLEALSTLVSHRPLTITPELISWADDHSAFDA